MNKRIILLLFVFFIKIFILFGQKNVMDTMDFSVLKGTYLGQDPPGMIPQVFAPGFLSTDSNEFNCSFTKEGDAVFYTLITNGMEDIMVIEQVGGIWQRPKPASFSSEYREVDPFVTPDGKRIFFSSNRPSGSDIEQEDCDFWYVEKQADGRWGEPKYLNYPKTKEKHDYYYTISKMSTVFFSIFENDTLANLYFIPFSSENASPQKFGYPINTQYREHDPFVGPDNGYLIFSSNRPGGFGSNDLYISFKNKDSLWLEPINMGDAVNSAYYDFCPILSPDGKYFFFSSYRKGNGDVYWVDARIIKKLKPDYLK